MSNTKSTGIKKKIAAGFIILLLFATIGIYSVIRLAVQLYPSDEGVSASVKKLTLTSALLSSIIESDGQARAYINTGKNEYLDKFRKQEETTKLLIDSLKLSSIDNTNQYLRAIAVDSLLEFKRSTLNEFFSIRRKSSSIKNFKLVEVIKDYTDTIRVPRQTISKTVTQHIAPVKEKKKGLLPRLWQEITGKNQNDKLVTANDSTHVKYDTVTTYSSIKDSTLKKVRTQLRRIEDRENESRQFIVDRELKLIQADQDVMNEIRAILLLFEKEEITNTISSANKGQVVLDKLWSTALILAALGIITTVGFIILIWKDLARSAFYRRQLEEARTYAESLLKVKEQFLANMSHEIRTPLTTIIGFSEQLRDTEINQEQSKYLKYIHNSSEHLLELINDLLDFSKIESGKLILDNRPFNISELLEDAFNSLSAKAKEKGLQATITLNIPRDIILVGDPLRFRQIILNILGNSVKFTGEGKIMLHAKGNFLDHDKSYELTIRIADTGIGIPPEKQKIIFEEFSQVDPGITRKYGGSGLGLAITRKLVDSMDGNISVISRPERGTIFTVRLILPVSTELINTSTNEQSLKPLVLNGIHVLLADDDVTTRILISDILSKQKAIVYEASDGFSAFDIFSKEYSKINLIITDIQMPGISGLEFVTKVKKHCIEKAIAAPPIIALTAHADQNEISHFIEMGIYKVILKPFKQQELLDLLSKSNSYEKSTTNEIKSNGVMQIDLSGFRQFAGDDENSLNKIISSLIINIETTKGELKKAFNEKKYMELALLAHRIQPNVRLSGAKYTSELLKRLELTSRNEPSEYEKIKSLYEEVISEMTNLKASLETVIH